MQADDKTMGLLCHLLGIFTSFIGPLVIWLMKKDQSPYVDTQGKEAMNFQLSMLIYIVALGIICMIPFVGCLFYIVAMAVPVFALVMAIIASIKANEGKIYRYPVCIRFIK
ncbi:MAG: DUF4870 domain-containing protein [Anaerolineaceae bacterium]|nr:DUF4870 domain-containing protein [Anaerolineaceae bacterium]